MEIAKNHSIILMVQHIGRMATETIQRFIMRQDTRIPEIKSLTDFLRSIKVKKSNRAEHGVNVLHSHIYMVSSDLKIFK